MRLRAAREEKGLSLEDVAAQTRIPRRHLESIENAQWDNLPAPTYTIGFAKSYASVVGLDRTEVGDQLREEMGGQRFASTSTDVFEPADPRRTMPKGVVFGAIIAVVLLVAGMSWLNKRSLEQPSSAPPTEVPANEAPAPAPRKAPAAPIATAAPQGPVVLTATAPVWLQVRERGGPVLYSGTLQPNQTYTVPASATAPVLKTGKPEALKVTVGTATAPPLGAPATTISNVSLLPADMMKLAAGGGAQMQANPGGGAAPGTRGVNSAPPAATQAPANTAQ
jgi:cytoskeletal protein RodZ